jgi:CDP-6-deoxy-D-xylo-4-hexulose-3-dehydrase
MKYISFGGIKQNWREFFAVSKVFFSSWHAAGLENNKLENKLCQYTGAKYCICVNSGSSANLLSLASLELEKGSKVLTSGCGFPATLNPILHLGLSPVLVDYEVPSYNIDLNQVEDALKKNQDIKAMIFAHTLGNPVDLDIIKKLSNKYGFFVVEDCCEALGSTFDNKHVGTFGNLGTFSFYPSHQISGLGMGGAIITDDEKLALKIRSMRSWGKLVRSTQFSGDHLTDYVNEIDGIKYDDQFTYETCGWNMLLPDACAAYAKVQMDKLSNFVRRRKENYENLDSLLTDVPILKMQIHPKSNPSYFGYVINLTKGDRDRFSDYLISNNIKSRPFFAGNITRHKPFRYLFQEFAVGDNLMKNALFIGVWHGIGKKEIKYMANKIAEYFDV